jgi:pimeloyl-ACP methyl ester carboxylesterase
MSYPSPVEWQQTGHYLPYSGLNIFSLSRGSGRPVLVLHGFPTASFDFSRLTPLLGEQYRLILFDYPGFGFSDKPARYPYSLFRYADVAQSIATYYGLQQVYLLAHDIGDSVALELLRRGYPTIKKLILLNGSIFSIPLDDYKMLLLQKLLLHPINGPILSKLAVLGKPIFSRMFPKIFYNPLPKRDIEAFWTLLKYNKGTANYHRLIRYMVERWEHQAMWLDVLAAHPADLALIWGQGDPVATPAVADHVLQRRPDAVYFRLDGVGHYPHWEAPAQVATPVQQVFG